MFGPDTLLIIDAMQLSAIVAGVTGAAVYLAMRWRRTSKNRRVIDQAADMNLEERVRVLERIATDRSVDLADEIEALRQDRVAQSPSQPIKGQS